MSNLPERGKFADRMQSEGFEVRRGFQAGFAIHEAYEANGDYVASLLDSAGQSVESVRVPAATLRFFDQHLGGAEQLRIERRKSLEQLGEKMEAVIPS